MACFMNALCSLFPPCIRVATETLTFARIPEAFTCVVLAVPAPRRSILLYGIEHRRRRVYYYSRLSYPI